MGAVGAWKYYQTPGLQRAGLPWFAQPWFWVPALIVVALCLTKDVLGPATPLLLKKPIDVAEAIENKISGLVAAGLFVPLLMKVVQSVNQPSASLSSLGLATIDVSPLLYALLVPVGVAVFAMVWLAAHTVNVLILLSPFATVDAALKGARALLLSLVTLTALVNPYVGAACAVGVIVASYFLSGWAFRLWVFGAVFIWDWITLRHRHAEADREGSWGFTARPMDQTPVRSYGQIARNAKGQLTLRFRSWLIGPPREVVFPEGEYAVGRGLFYPELHWRQGAERRSVLVWPPRYRTHEAALARQLGLASVRDVGLLKGLRAAWEWVRSWIGVGPAPAT